MKDIRPFKECFELSDTIRAQHLLFQDYLKEDSNARKFIFYLALKENGLRAKYGKDKANGCIGYGLAYVER